VVGMTKQVMKTGALTGHLRAGMACTMMAGMARTAAAVAAVGTTTGTLLVVMPSNQLFIMACGCGRCCVQPV